ncbi:hypothetical protein HPP92_012145 [Vanilla planifolia]|uniref:non-specific serine/threonine protein kinase n=1 Tax=Vanilla planifolia TaxID=51239 RepID=A0A835V5P9_VANPL|nr:hypothetical protein HPP92_012145 [Vanilla planifolia]
MYRRIHRREYRFPSWFSTAAKRLISRLLDPNPETRITIDAITDLSWFRRANSLGDNLNLLNSVLPPPDQQQLAATASPLSTAALNAFDIISLSIGLDLSGLFDCEGRVRRESRFTSTAAPEAVFGKIEEVSGKLGYVFERRKEGVCAKGLGRWGAVMTVEVAEVAPPMLLVIVKVEGGSCNEQERPGGLCWEELKAELGDLVFAWHTD